MTMHLRSLLILSALIIPSLLSAQAPSDEQQFDFIPSSPNASALGEYGSHPVDLSNGAVNVSIPIYTFKAGELSVPISMSYRTTGLKVDDTESWLGLGWTLNAGGIVNRTIMDHADEDGFLDPNAEATYLPYPENVNMSDWQTLEYIYRDLTYSNMDTQPDEFSFNFLGQSGKFFFNRSGEAITIPKQKLLIKRTFNDLGHGEIEITTQEGVKYFFGGDYEESSNLTSAGSIGCSRNFDIHRVSAWYLYRIEHPTGTVVYLEYEPVGYYQYDHSLQRIETRLDSQEGCGSHHCDEFSETICRSVFEMQTGQKLSRIYSEGYGSVEFDISGSGTRLSLLQGVQVRDKNSAVKKSYTFDYHDIVPSQFKNDYTVEGEPRYFLYRFSELDHATGNIIATHEFNYYDLNSIPPRLSYAQDHWGYFNGKNNADLLPRSDHYLFRNSPNAVADRSPDGDYAKMGSLSEIIYPTGGSTEFYYEPHTIWGDSESKKKSSFQLKASPSERKTDVVTSTIDQVVQATFILNRTANDGTTWKNSNFYIYEITSHGKTELFRRQLDEILPPNPDQPYPGDEAYREVVDLVFKENTAYEVEIQLGDGTNMEAIIAFDYYGEETKVVKSNIEAGGIRISKIVKRPESHDPSRITTYDYSVFDTSRSSGHQRFRPRYVSTIYYQFISDNECTNTCISKMLNANSNSTLYSASGNHITYSNVTINHGSSNENGKEEIEFKVMDDAYARIVDGEEILSAPLSNFAWGNGEELSRKIYKKTSTGFQLVKKVEHELVSDAKGYDITKSMVIRERYDPVVKYQFSFDCTEENVEETYEYFTCTAKHPHRWLLGGYWIGKNAGKTRCTRGDAKNQWVVYKYHPCNGKKPGTKEYSTKYFNHIDVAEYQRQSHWFYKSSTTETRYGPDGDSLVTRYDYGYDNHEHLQRSTTTMTQSNGDEIVTYIYYPEDFDGSTLTAYNLEDLQEGNFVVPIKSERTVNGNQVEGNVVVYNSKGQPVEQYEYRNTTLVPPSAHSSSTYIPNEHYELGGEWQYDNNGKPIEFRKTDDSPVTFFWGYDGNFPVAKVYNLSRGGVPGSAINNIASHTYSISGIRQEIETDINALEGYLSDYINSPDYLVTIFTYIPLYGLTSRTDPSGNTFFYYYDSNGRLKHIEDEEGNTVEQYEYNYAAPQKTSVMELSRTALDFEGVLAGSSKTLSFTITNAGDDNLQINSHSITSPFHTNFPHSTNIPPGESAKVNITFSPEDKIAYSGSIQFSTNEPDETEGEDIVTFSGFGEDEKREMSLSETTIDFGSVAPVGIKYVDVMNNGNTPLELFCYETTNPEFEVVTALPKTIEPGKSLQLQLSFTPQGPHQQTGTITIDSNKTSGENEISVTGKRSF